jgi:hypothetical protein
VIDNIGLSASRAQLVFTSASMIAILNSVVAGVAVALLIGAAFGAAPGVAVAAGAAAAVALAIAHLHPRGTELHPGVRVDRGAVPIERGRLKSRMITSPTRLAIVR